MVVFGDRDKYLGVRPELVNNKKFSKKNPKAKKFNSVITKETPHGYQGREKKLVELIAD